MPLLTLEKEGRYLLALSAMLWLNIIIKCIVYAKSGQLAYVGNSLIKYVSTFYL